MDKNITSTYKDDVVQMIDFMHLRVTSGQFICMRFSMPVEVKTSAWLCKTALV